jgi:hypothetical protein
VYEGESFSLSLANEAIGRAVDEAQAFLQDMGVDHRGRHASLAQELLHCPDVVSVLQQMGGERVPVG